MGSHRVDAPKIKPCFFKVRFLGQCQVSLIAESIWKVVMVESWMYNDHSAPNMQELVPMPEPESPAILECDWHLVLLLIILNTKSKGPSGTGRYDNLSLAHGGEQNLIRQHAAAHCPRCSTRLMLHMGGSDACGACC